MNADEGEIDGHRLVYLDSAATSQKPQVVITNELLVGLDGTMKMSKSKGNYIGICEAPETIFGKAMSISDEMMEKYYVLATDLPLEEMDALLRGGTHPRQAKARIAAAIVRRYHGEEAAHAAAEEFSRLVAESVSTRRREAERAEAIVASEAEGFDRWLDATEQVTPAVISLRSRFEQVLGEELERSLRGRLKHLGQEERAALAKLNQFAEAAAVLGKQEDVITLLNISDLYMIPSKSESFGLSALEALSCGVPVIGSSIGGLREVIEHGISGYIIDSEDIQMMGDTAARILTDQALWEKISTASRKRAELFDVDIMVLHTEYQHMSEECQCMQSW